MMDQKRRHERSELTVAMSYRKEMRPQTLKHTVPTTSDSPTTHHLHKESHLEPACTPKRNHTSSMIKGYFHGFALPDRKSAPPPEKRLRVDKKVESTSEAYPSPQNQSTSSLDQTALRFTGERDSDTESHTAEHTQNFEQQPTPNTPRRTCS
ncbi:hypothetical protein YC2023_004910 [Brassica napus]